MCLYSTYKAFTQHKHEHNKHSFQGKRQKLADKEIFERHLKPQADPWWISGGARGNVTICFC